MVVPVIGVLALQGGVREHAEMLTTLGASVRLVRRATDLDGLDGLVLPGGESAVMERLAKLFGLWLPLRAAIRAGLPVLATCAGLILLAQRIRGAAPEQEGLGVLDIEVARNAFGSQRDSFDAMVDVREVGAVDASFIRAPIVVGIGKDVEVIANVDDGRIVGVRSGRIIAVSFHPEVSGDTRLHRVFLDSLTATPARRLEPESVS